MNEKRRSARETFANCKYRYKAEYLDGLSSENNATRRGTVFHDARSHYIGALFDEKLTSDAETAERAWKFAICDRPLPTAEYWDVRSLWERWTEQYELNLSTYYSVEQDTFCKPFGCTLRFDEAHVPEPQTFQIIDAKTHWRVPSIESLRTNVQTGMYLAGARHLFPGFQIYQIVYEFVRFNQEITITLSPAELDGWDRWVRESDEAIDIAHETGLYPPTGGAHCGTCLVKCPLADHPGIAPLRLTSERDAKDAIQRIAARRRMAELEAAALAEYCNEHGPVSEGGQIYNHRVEASMTYPASQVVDILREQGVPFEPYLTATAVKSLVTTKKHAAIAPLIQATAVAKLATRFGAKAETGDESNGSANP